MRSGNGQNSNRGAAIVFAGCTVVVWLTFWTLIAIDAGGFLPPWLVVILTCLSALGVLAVAVFLLLIFDPIAALILCTASILGGVAAVFTVDPRAFAYLVESRWWVVTIVPALPAAHFGLAGRTSQNRLTLRSIGFWLLLCVATALSGWLSYEDRVIANAPRVEPSKSWDASIKDSETFLAADADVNANDSNGRTFLHYAAQRADVTFVRFLIEQGADVDAKDWWGETPIFSAAKSAWYVRKYGQPSPDLEASAAAVVAELLAAGAAVNLRSKGQSETPLSIAAHYGTPGIIELLVRAGADVDATTASGLTPLHASSSSRSVAPRNASMLISLGARVDPRDSKGRTPLHAAAKMGASETVRILVAAGADPNEREHSGKTPLHFAVEPVDGPEKISILSAAGADPNLRDNRGCTPLHIAVPWTGRIETIKALLVAGADLSLGTQGEFWTPAQIYFTQKEAFRRRAIDELLERRVVAGPGITAESPKMADDLCSPYRD